MRWGTGIALVSLAAAYIVAPVARRWSAREDAIAAAHDAVARLQGLVAATPTLRAASVAPGDPGPRVLRGRTTALVGSALQALLQDLARASRTSVTRLEVASDSGSASERGVVAALTATTDIYGVADFLSRVHGSDIVLAIDDLQVTTNPVLRGDLLQMTVSVRAPFLLEP